MEANYCFFGTIVFMLLTNHYVQANVDKTPTSKDSLGGVRSGSQDRKVGGTNQADSETPSSEMNVEPSSKANLERNETTRTSSGSGGTKKSTESMKKVTSSNKKENEEVERIKITKTAEGIKQMPKSVVNNEHVPDMAVETPIVRTIQPSRILVMLPMSLYSHTQNYMPIFKELARRGHHVTVVSPYPQNISSPNWEEIAVPNTLKELMAILPDPDFSKQPGFFEKTITIMTFGEKAMQLTLELKPVINMYNDDSRKFDLVFVEAQFFQEPLLAFGHKFKAPVIALYPSYIVPEVAYYTGNPFMTMTYVPNLLLPFSNAMSFVERAINTASSFFEIIFYNFWTIPTMDRLMRQYLPSKDLPYVADLLFNVSFTFIDAHHVLTYPYPRVNNMREFLGINSKPTSKLNQELEEYMNGGEDGVLFFTLGSHFQTSTLRPHVLEALLAAFSRIPNRILMKWDKEEPPVGLSPNVKTQKWFPQSAILAHKNCKAFVTHTGVHGLIESLDHAVPVISVPLFADQHFYARWVEEKGVGLSIDIETVTPEIAYQTISEVITNRKYKENAIEISKLMNDLPRPTLDELSYWVEYVIRTKGAPLLRSGALNLQWYQRLGLDLLTVAVIIIVVTIWLIIAVFKCLISMCRRNKKPDTGSNIENVKSKKAKKRD